MEMKVSFYLFIFITLELFFVKSQIFSNTNDHEFSNDLDVKVLVNGIPVIIPKEFSSSQDRLKDTSADSLLTSNIQFQPVVLDFKERYLGIPHHEKVTIINLSLNRTIRMSSISGSTVHFHSSFFEKKLIPPLGNTTFNVVFLGREEGEVESNLFIHTSLGSLKYQVRGISIQSPYRLRPLSGIRLPLNASFTPLINLHNPFSTPIQLVEVFSSGGDFHLELPSGELEGPKQLWEIPAFYTKPVIRVRFHAHTQKNHTAYIRLKVNHSEEVLIVPLEVEVSPFSGIYSPDDMIDFGMGGNQDPPKTLWLYLKNSWKKPIKIQNIVSTPASKALKIDFKPIKIPPDSQASTKVASLTFNWKLALEMNHTKGKLVIKSSGVGGGVEKLVISYIARTMQGGLIFDTPVIEFRPSSADLFLHPFHIKNTFSVPVVVMNVSLPPEALKQFEITDFKPILIMPGQKLPIFKLNLLENSEPFTSLDTALTIHSNVSSIKVPLLRYSGRLMKVTECGEDLILGTVGSRSIITTNIGLINSNPAPVKLESWGSDLSAVSVELLGTSKNSSGCIDQLSVCKYNDSKSINPGHQAVLKVSVKTDKAEKVIDGNVWVESEFERISFTLQMKVVNGKIKVVEHPVTFKDCFPEKVCSTPLEVSSEFHFPMNVLNISHSHPNSEGLSFVPANSASIEPLTSSVVGHLIWNPPVEVFRTFLYNTSENNQFVDSLSLPPKTADWDLQLLTKQIQIFNSSFSKPLNFSMKMDTSEVKRHLFDVQLPLSWPNISSHLIEFPLTLIGNYSVKKLTIINFSHRYPAVIQIVPFSHYKLSDDTLESAPFLSQYLNYTGESPRNSSQFSIILDEPSLWRQETAHRESIMFLMPPASNVTLSVCFTPTTSESSFDYIVIRNNLTTVELVKLFGTGTELQFKFGNRKPGSDSPLLFELTEKHLKDCDRDKSQKDSGAPNLTVKRSFTARNTGELPITILRYLISGLPNEGFGFKVLNPEPFVLLPNSTRKVEVAFTPDFTLARIERTISIITDMSVDTNYSLVATLPTYMLASCSAALHRPLWEPILYFAVIGIKLTLLICIIFAAFLESDRLLKTAVISRSQDSATQPVLDLRMVVNQDSGVKNSKHSDKETKSSAVNSNDETFCDPSSQSCSWLNTSSSTASKEKTKSKSGNNYSQSSSSTSVKKRNGAKRSETSSWSTIFNSSINSSQSASNTPKVQAKTSHELNTKSEDTNPKPLPNNANKSSNNKANCSGDPEVPKKPENNRKSKSLNKSKKESAKLSIGLTKKNLDEWNSSYSSPSSSNSSCHEKEFKKIDSRSSTSAEFRETNSKPSTPKQNKMNDKIPLSQPIPNGPANSTKIDCEKEDCDKPTPKKTKQGNKNINKLVNKVNGHKKTNSLDSSVIIESPSISKKQKAVLTNVKSLPLNKNKDKINNSSNNTGSNCNTVIDSNSSAKHWKEDKNTEFSRMMAGISSLTPASSSSFCDQSCEGNRNRNTRPSFSDVVSRNDNHSSAYNFSASTFEQTSNLSAPLPDPIEPKKSTPSTQNSWGNSSLNLFPNLPPVGNCDKSWDQSASIVLKILQEEERKKNEAQLNNALLESWPNSIPSLWDTPLPSSQNSQGLLNSSSLWGNPSPIRNNSVWSNDVWAPPTSTAVPRTPLRPPPGLGPSERMINPPVNIYSNPSAQSQLHKKKLNSPFQPSTDSSLDVPPSQEFDPFRSLSNIWSPQSPSIWNSNPPSSN